MEINLTVGKAVSKGIKRNLPPEPMQGPFQIGNIRVHCNDQPTALLVARKAAEQIRRNPSQAHGWCFIATKKIIWQTIHSRR